MMAEFISSPIITISINKVGVAGRFLDLAAAGAATDARAAMYLCEYTHLQLRLGIYSSDH